uniref:GxGYxYP putative glycoside hydrolase C-terminal domain-containing protein n=1 Tax=candidate division WOR-3 bacterium TaxID=2052148 RepID=A0A7V0Z723_UNCW3
MHRRCTFVLYFYITIVLGFHFRDTFAGTLLIHKETETFSIPQNQGDIVVDQTAYHKKCLALLKEIHAPVGISTTFEDLTPGIYQLKCLIKGENKIMSINPVCFLKIQKFQKDQIRILGIYPVYASYFNEIHNWQNFNVYFYLSDSGNIQVIIEWLDSLDLFIDYVELSRLRDDRGIVYAVNLQDLNLDSEGEPFDFKMADRRQLLGSIQGGINRTGPRLVLLHNYNDYEAQGIYRWLKRFNLPYVLLTYDECIKKFVSKNDFKGCVLFDPGNPDSIAIKDPPEYQKLLFQIKAIATNLAALESLLIITPRTINDIPLADFPIKYDLTDSRRYKFLNDSTGSEALKFNLKLFQTRKFNRDIIFKLLPYMSFSPVRNACEKLIDFTIQNRYWSFYYDLRDTSDKTFFHSKVFNKTHFLMGWSDEGWIQGTKYYCKEYEHIKMASKAGKLWIGDMNRIHNLSFFAKLPLLTGEFKQSPPKEIKLERKVYIAFISMDGDNPVLILQHYARDWDSPLRGQIPFSWGIPPKLIDIAPGILQYYYQTKTPNDCFIADVSGLAWHLVNHFDFEDFPDMPIITARYLKKLNLSIIKIMADRNDDLADINYLQKIANAYPDLLGFLEGYWPPNLKGFAMINEKIPSLRLAVNRPLKHLGDTTDIEPLVDEILRMIKEHKERPLFLPVIYNIYNPNYTTTITVFDKLKRLQTLLNKIDENIEYIRLDEMMILIKKYYSRID